jgi:hypothetical protein
MVELRDFLNNNLGKRVILVTSSGIFDGEVVSANTNLVELHTVIQGLSVGAAALSSLTITVDSVTAWGTLH